MRGRHRGLGPQRGANGKRLTPSQSGFLLLSGSAEDGLSLGPIVRPVTHSYSGNNLQRVSGLSDVLQLRPMCTFAYV